MGWTSGELEGRFTSRAAIAFDLGDEFASRVIDAARLGRVIYAAVATPEGDAVFALVLLTERRDGLLHTKPVGEEVGPLEDSCPARILDLLTAPANEYAEDWRRRCRARLARPRPRSGQVVIFANPIEFTDGSVHRILTFERGSRFRSREGVLYRVIGWKSVDYRLGRCGGEGDPPDRRSGTRGNRR